ncbi:YkvA family protein [Vallitalea okinawensis]|uniref:YkvA family protein n=1 Tax=Vallitalea okinawensis TaxID=2078660 RepID=UPI001A9A301B
MMGKLKELANELKRHIQVIYLAYRDKETPLYAKVVSFIVVAYALSPIDLIPDFIPILGYLDDLILVPLGIYLAIKLIPREIFERYKNQTEKIYIDHKIKVIGSLCIFVIWITIILLLVHYIVIT